MDPEVLLPCLHDIAAGPYLEQDESSPHPQIPLRVDPFLIFSSHLRQGTPNIYANVLPLVLFLQFF